MAKKILFLKDTPINGVTYKKGDKLQVSNSIYTSLIKGGIAKDAKEDTPLETIEDKKTTKKTKAKKAE